MSQQTWELSDKLYYNVFYLQTAGDFFDIILFHKSIFKKKKYKNPNLIVFFFDLIVFFLP